MNVVKFAVILIFGAGLLAPLTAARAETTIERGEYLVRAANCVSCHTVPGGQVFAGGVPFPTDFGTIYSTNITPDKATGIGSWTFEQFDAAVRRGVRPDGQHLYPAFPYTSFTKINDADLHALYDYFMSLRPVSAPAKSNDMSFPYNQRWLLGAWNALYFDEGRFVPDPKRSAQWRSRRVSRGGTRSLQRLPLAAQRSGCGKDFRSRTRAACSTSWTRNEARVRRGAPNLTSSPHGLKAWSEDDLAGYLKSGVGSRARLMGTMNEVVLNSTRHLSEQDTRAMAIYLKSLAPARRYRPAAQPEGPGSPAPSSTTSTAGPAICRPAKARQTRGRRSRQRLCAGTGSVFAHRPGHQWPAPAGACAVRRVAAAVAIDDAVSARS